MKQVLSQFLLYELGFYQGELGCKNRVLFGKCMAFILPC